MPCAFSGHDASAADSHLLATLGNVGELCKHCRVTIRNVLTRKDNVAVDSNIGGYLDDYIRMYVVLSSHALFLQRIAEFGQRIAADAAGQERGLSYHLKRFETRCHFPDVEVIPTGVLSADEFYDMIARGVMWKDVGAGLDHGLYAHRLQWHVLLATITEGFTVARAPGWDHGGYDLFVSLGVQGRAFNVWGKMLDNSNNPCFRAPEYVERHIDDALIRSRIDTKYAKYHEAYANIATYAFQAAKERATKKGALDMAKLKRLNFEITDAVWATYYFGRRDIRAALPRDRKDFRKFSAAHLDGARRKPVADDASDRFARDRTMVENKTVRLQSQAMPTPAQVNALRLASAATLNN